MSSWRKQTVNIVRWWQLTYLPIIVGLLEQTWFFFHTTSLHMFVAYTVEMSDLLWDAQYIVDFVYKKSYITVWNSYPATLELNKGWKKNCMGSREDSFKQDKSIESSPLMIGKRFLLNTIQSYLERGVGHAQYMRVRTCGNTCHDLKNALQYWMQNAFNSNFHFGSSINLCS